MADGGGDGRLRWTAETKNTIMKVLGIAIAAVLTLVSVLPGSSSGAHIQPPLLRPSSVVLGQLPSDFYLLALATNLLVVCITAIVVLLWSVPGRPLIIYLTVTILIIYALLMIRIMPKFNVEVGGHSLTSYVLVWPVALVLIFGAILAYQLIIFIYFCFRTSARVFMSFWSGLCDVLGGQIFPAIREFVCTA